MNDDRLKSFYKLIALGEFEQALELVKNSAEDIAEPDKVIIETLKFKNELQKFLSFETI